MALLFTEWGEIWQSLAAIVWHIAYPILMVAIVNALAFLLWRKTRTVVLRVPFLWLLLLALFGVLPARAYKAHDSQGFYPNPEDCAISNTLYAVSYSVGHGLKGGDRSPGQRYRPYQVVQLPMKTLATIVVVMGESLTYKHMSLFGYPRETTPELEKLKTDPNFVFLPAIAGGVATKASLPAFLNVQREPGNTGHLISYESNLLKMAKARGYATYYISAQTANLTTYAGVEFADRFITKEHMEPLYDQLKDGVLLHHLGRIDLSTPAFIVLHQRNSHGPDEQSYPAEFGKYPIHGGSYADYVTNAYDNSVGYTDHLLASIIEMLKNRSTRPTYLFFTSDHGEMTGEGGKYGHGFLDAEVARVPFIFYAIGTDPGQVDRMRTLAAPTHYEIGREIAALLGYQVIDPNEMPGRYYVNGSDLGGGMGCMAIAKDPAAEYGWRTVPDRLCNTAAATGKASPARKPA